MRRTAALVCALALLAAIPQPRPARGQVSPAGLRQKLQERLDAFHAAGKFPGATLGVALADGTSFGLAAGLADRDSKTPMTPEALMLQGSVGKTYAAAVALQLVGEKKLALDDRIEKYLGREGWFARLPNARDITVRMLLNHTSGLVRYEFKEQFTRDLAADPDRVWKPEELIAYVLDTRPPFAAGAGWEYSDTNYIVLGMIVERVTGGRYYEEVRRRLLRPLGLARTVPSDGRRIPGLVQGYAGPDNPFGGTDAMIVGGRFAINPQFEWTGGGMASTAEDLARWAAALYEGRAFDRSLMAEVLRGVPAPMLGPETHYGLGVIIRRTPLGASYGHSGFFPGYVTEMVYFPDLRAALAVQVNTSVPRATPKPLGRFLVELAEVIAAETRGPESAGDFGELERIIEEELRETRTPGAAVAVISGGRVVFAKGFGVASVETAAPVTPDTLFRLGSTTKMFTGAALVALAGQGKLRLDAPVGDFAEGLAPRLSGLTAHQLLSNQAGVADFAAPFVSHDDAALARMVRGWKDDDALFAGPGRIYSYSSPGFWLAGYVAEEAAGKPYADVMEEVVFRPLGMARTTLRPLVAMTYPLAVGHGVQEGRAVVIRPAFNNVAMWPAGSVYSSANDLSRFALAFLHGGQLEGKQALPASVFEGLSGRHVPLPGGEGVHYGYGLLNFEQRGVRLLMHGGFSRGYGSMLQLAPEHKFAVVVVANASGQTMPRTVEKAREMFLPLKPEAAGAGKKALTVSADDLKKFAGAYVNGPQTWEVVSRDGRLALRRDGSETPLSKTGDLRLSFGDSLEQDLVFVAGPEGRAEYLFDGLYSARRVAGGRGAGP
ncbi:MAG TPA: serine hydrolase domain-containing protein [Pyrinomonadaceae bacterium]|nr:serine hydrolase domain-containing protein [Pyrinomonadaceae bacterium]